MERIKNTKGFTLIELLVVIGVLGILVLLAMPMFGGYTKDANFAKGVSNAKMIEDASQLYYMDNDDWPRLTDDHYTQEQMNEYAERFYDNTGKEIELDPNGKYYDIDYDGLNQYVRVNDDKRNYILQNPVGKIYYMEDVTDSGLNRVDYEDNEHVAEKPGEHEDDLANIPIAKDGDFEWVNNSSGYDNNGSKGYYKYIGQNKAVKIPHEIGGLELTSYYRMFSNSPVEKVVSDNPNITDMRYTFYGNTGDKLDLSNFDTSNVTDMSNMFERNSSIELDVSNFDTYKVTNMRSMFEYSSIKVLDLSSFDMSNVSNTDLMIRGVEARTGYALNNIAAGKLNGSLYKHSSIEFRLKSNNDYTWRNDPKGYEVNGVKGYYKYIGDNLVVKMPHEIEGKTLTSYYRMFQQSDVSKVISDNPNIVDMGYMFSLHKGSQLDLSELDTSSVTKMNHMFERSKLKEIDLSRFNTSKVTDMSYMFSNTEATDINVTNFDTRNVTDMSYMFERSEVKVLDLSSFDTSSVTNMDVMLRGTQAREAYARTSADAGRYNESLYKSGWITFYLSSNNDFTWFNDTRGYEVNGVKGYYKYVGNDKIVTIPHEIEGKPLTSYYRMFFQADVEEVISDSPYVIDMSHMFNNYKGDKLKLENFDTSNVTDMNNMFSRSEVKILDLSNFDTSNVIDMNNMFSSSAVTNLELMSFDTSNVVNMSSMFEYNKGLSILDLSSFDTSKVENVDIMFRGVRIQEAYAKTEADASLLNKSKYKSSGFTFTVK